MNGELCKKVSEKVGNPNVLINLVSRRVRQLTTGGGATSRPLVDAPAHYGAADVALLEILEDKMGWELAEPSPVEAPSKKRKKH